MSVQKLMPIVYIVGNDHNYVEEVCPYCGMVLKVIDGNKEQRKNIVKTKFNNEEFDQCIGCDNLIVNDEVFEDHKLAVSKLRHLRVKKFNKNL